MIKREINSFRKRQRKRKKGNKDSFIQKETAIVKKTKERGILFKKGIQKEKHRDGLIQTDRAMMIKRQELIEKDAMKKIF